MDFKNKAPDWTAEGTEPPASLKTKGFEAGYRPPASYFNWFWSLVSKCLSELQEKVQQVRAVSDGGTGKSAVTSGSFLVGNGTGAMKEMTPEETRKHIGAASKNEAIPIVAAASADGIAYTATVDGLTELYNGLILTIVPEINSASTAPTLNVNGLGAKMLRIPLSFNNAAMTTPRLETYFSEGRPITVQYDANYTTGGAWKTLGKQRTSAQDLYGTVPIESGGTDADNPKDARENLGAVGLDAFKALLSGISYLDGKAVGESLTLTDSTTRHPLSMKLYGKTTKDGTTLTNAASSGSVKVTVGDVSTTVSTPDGLAGIPVSDGGDYTDATGQQWVGDVVDFDYGVMVKKTRTFVVTGSEDISYNNSLFVVPLDYQELLDGTSVTDDLNAFTAAAGACSHYEYLNGEDQVIAQDGSCYYRFGALAIHDSRYTDVSAFKAALAANPITFTVAYAKEIMHKETVLSEDVKAQYESMTTEYPETTITNNGGAVVVIEYAADPENYINNRVADQS